MTGSALDDPEPFEERGRSSYLVRLDALAQADTDLSTVVPDNTEKSSVDTEPGHATARREEGGQCRSVASKSNPMDGPKESQRYGERKRGPAVGSSNDQSMRT